VNSVHNDDSARDATRDYSSHASMPSSLVTHNSNSSIHANYVLATKWIVLFYRTNLPGSTCSTVFTRSKNVLARFSSPIGTVTLNTFTAPVDALAAMPMLDLTPGDSLLVGRDVWPDRISMISGSFFPILVDLDFDAGPAVKAALELGRAVICGM
jgi:hypothetical protein